MQESTTLLNNIFGDVTRQKEESWKSVNNMDILQQSNSKEEVELILAHVKDKN